MNIIREIEEKIGYKFENAVLLKQALTRRSFSQEQGGENNEVLEFIGDRVLEMAVVMMLNQDYCQFLEDGCFHSELGEGELTARKRDLVQKSNLAASCRKLALENYLIMGQGEIKNHAEQSISVQEDLVESIIGAVALDCAFDFLKIIPFINNLLA